MKNEFLCIECGGRGTQLGLGKPTIYKDGSKSYIQDVPCPSCNKGKVMIARECENSEDGGCSYAYDGTCSCIDGYRPLTEAELDEWVGNEDIGYILDHCSPTEKDNPVTFKGASVKLMPWNKTLDMSAE